MKVDTNLVNFALSKADSGCKAIAPVIKELSTEYVKYCVTDAIATASIWIVSSAILGGCSFFAYKAYLKHRKACTCDDGTPFFSLSAIAGFLSLTLSFAALDKTKDAILAVSSQKTYSIIQFKK